MRLFDLHCDTIGECWKQKKDLFENNLHLSLQRGSAYAPWRQVFAVFIPDSCRGEAAWNYFQGIYDDFLHQLETHKDAVSFCRTSDELARAEREGKCAAILSVEGGAVLGGRLDRIQKLHAMGVRLITLTWNGANELGCGCGKRCAGGLTPLGKAMELALQKIEEQKCLYDSCGITSKRPWIFLISDGEPTDYDWEIIAEKCRYAQKNKKVVVHAVGTQGANLEKLAKFSLISPKRLTGLKFTEFFLWLSRSVSCISKAAPNIPDQLEDTGDWNEN